LGEAGKGGRGKTLGRDREFEDVLKDDRADFRLLARALRGEVGSCMAQYPSWFAIVNEALADKPPPSEEAELVADGPPSCSLSCNSAAIAR